MRTVFFLTLLFATTACFPFPAASVQESPPKITLWAWERPENLLFLRDNKTEVAYYAGNVTFAGGKTVFTPRRQPLMVRPEIKLTAVVRIEKKENFCPDARQIAETIRFIAKTCAERKVSGCQVDFDCKNSEVGFFRNLITGLRKELPAPLPLSITALASWCHTGSWIESLPIDEAIPMLFRIGVDDQLVRDDLTGQSFLKADICRKSVGISLDEPFPPAKYLKDRKIYLFNPRPWTPEAFSGALTQIRRRLHPENNP
jgi:hypothetical protein